MLVRNIECACTIKIPLSRQRVKLLIPISLIFPFFLLISDAITAELYYKIAIETKLITSLTESFTNSFASVLIGLFSMQSNT